MTSSSPDGMGGAGGIEVSGLTSITRTTDQRKNQRENRRENRRRRKPRPPETQDRSTPAKEQKDDVSVDATEEDQDKPTVDYLA
ncbi:MAG: hypothetical protein J7M14_00655 [Planctomycetes bacterium]|nr:hypothetical protein [Planctomycetota bacterium]